LKRAIQNDISCIECYRLPHANKPLQYILIIAREGILGRKRQSINSRSTGS